MRPVWMRRKHAPALAGEAAQAVHGAVDDVLVDGVVDGGDEARQPSGQVHDPVDDVLVEPGQEGRQEERRPDHQRVVGLVDVVLVEDQGPDAEEAVLEVVRHAALVVLEELHGEEPADGGRGHAHALEEPLGGVAEVEERHLGWQRRGQPVLQDGPWPVQRSGMPRKETATAPKASMASTQVIERGDSCGTPPWWPWSSWPPEAWSSCAGAAWATWAAAGAACPCAAWSSWPWPWTARRGVGGRVSGVHGVVVWGRVRGVRILVVLLGVSLAAPVLAGEGHVVAAEHVEAGARSRPAGRRRRWPGRATAPGVPNSSIPRCEGLPEDLVLGEEAAGPGEAGDGPGGDQVGPGGDRHELLQPAHLPHVLLVVAAEDHGARAEEEAGLEEGVRQQVEDPDPVGADADAHEHEAELAAPWSRRAPS